MIGRAPRRNSHTHLPPSERFVHVYRLVLVKPKAPGALLPDDKHAEAADEILRSIIAKKQREIVPFERHVVSVSNWPARQL